MVIVCSCLENMYLRSSFLKIMTTENLTIQITKVNESKITQVDWENLPFGRVFSDHILIMDYINGAWKTPEIVPFDNLNLHPATSALHYGQAVFEGMKANRMVDGKISVFRPEMNAARFRESCARMCMAEIDENVFVSLLAQFIKIEKDWIPQKEGYSLYLRPFMFATDSYIGVKPSDSYRFAIFACPVGAYYTEPVNVKIEEFYTRAANGGVGRAKAAGNYAAALYPAKLAQSQGFHQLIWTDAISHEYIEESGTMNIVFVINGKMISPSEDSDTILRGVTKRSVLEIAKMWGIPVEERKVSVKEVIEAAKNGSLEDAFGAGTAATIAPIAKIGFRDEVFQLPAIETRTLSNKIKTYLDQVKSGEIQDDNNWCLKIN